MKPEVMKSAAGYYLGTRTTEGFPNSRDSGYFYSRWEVLRLMGAVLEPEKNTVLTEIEEEAELAATCAKKAKGVRKYLLIQRMWFLRRAAEQVKKGLWPTEEWDYSIMC